jgi:hypothetical protein
MGCFSFLCKKCNRPINSTSSRGQRTILFLLKDGEVIEKMQGEYDSYGRVFDEQGKSIYWEMDWSDVCELMFDPNEANGICAYHERCYTRNSPVVTRSSDDRNQGWGRFKLPPIPFKKG